MSHTRDSWASNAPALSAARNGRLTMIGSIERGQLVARLQEIKSWRRTFWNAGSILVELVKNDGEVLRYEQGYTRTYIRNYNLGAEGGVPALISEPSPETLQVTSIGTALASEEPVEGIASFVEYLKVLGRCMDVERFVTVQKSRMGGRILARGNTSLRHRRFLHGEESSQCLQHQVDNGLSTDKEANRWDFDQNISC